ncbi:amino acid adenylation domain-containing protein [Actinokineospora guangxiensis]|uniref:Phenyloxazoline synthase MbtB n=1 Tax=Actinokineospora guangxiensis TaxID=1490288 RepID=A0ABW0ENX9_9PSEU
MSAPLSHGQERMWLLDQLTDGAALTLASAVTVHGPLSLAAARRCLAEIVHRHDVLRTVITVEDGAAVQLVRAAEPVPVRLVDLSGLAPRAADAARARVLAAEARRRFDLARGPVFRFTIIRSRRDEHAVVLALHHAATDAWSMRLIAQEFAAAYRRTTCGVAEPTPPPAPQYHQFARERRRLPPPSDRLSARLAELAGPHGEALPLDGHPGDRARTAAVWTSALPPSLTARLHALRTTEGGSLFMLVLAALAAVLHRLTGDDRIAIGTLSAGRTRPEHEHALGYFGNVLVVLADFTRTADTLTFRNLWRRVRDDCVRAYDLQDLPYEVLVEHLRPDQAARSAPLVSVVCVQQQPPRPITLPGLDTELLDVPHAHAHHDLTVEVTDDNGVLQLSWQYDSSVLTEATVVRLSRHLRVALSSLVDNPDLACADLPLDPSEPPRGAPGLSEDTLHGLFEAQAARTPDATALRCGAAHVTFAGLNARANRLARRLRAVGVRPEDRVAVLLPRSPEAVTAQLAILKAGAAYLPLDPSHPQARWSALLTDSDARCVVTTADLRDQLPDTVAAVVVDDHSDTDSSNLGLAVAADQAAYVIYTSGSTGEPKGVLGPHRGMVNRLRWMWSEHPYRPDEIACHRTSPTFVDSLAEVFGPLLHGVPAEVLDQDTAADPDTLVGALARARVTRLLVVPSLLRALLDLAARLPALAVWTCSGEPLPDDLAARFHRELPGRRLLNLYGSTEIAADATATTVDADFGTVGIGTPIPGVTASVRTRAGGWAPPLGVGELFVGGDAVARGYLGKPGPTAAAFVPDPTSAAGARAFKTGDVVRVGPDSALRHLGRVDGQVQVRGVRADPSEVERALRLHPAVSQAVVVPATDVAGTTILVGHLVLDQPCPLEDLRAHARSVLPPHLVPAVLVDAADLPLTTSGKIDRRALAHAGIPTAGQGNGTQPRTPGERVIADLFAELLPTRWQSVHDDFFDLGGHSLLAAALVHRLRSAIGVSLGLRDLFAAPTIATLAARAANAHAAPSRTETTPTEHTGRYDPFPLTDVQQAYWIGRDPGFDLGNIATHGYFELSAPHLDTDRLTAAMAVLIARHDALRITVRPDGTQQVLATVAPFHIPEHDLRAHPAEESDRHLADLRDRMSHQVIPADRWPLFDLRVTRTGTGDVLHVSIDALIADAYSVTLLMGELATLYRDPTATLPPIGLTFRDCVLAREAERTSTAREEAWQYWRKRLSDLPPGPELPLTRSPADIDQPRFHRWARILPRSLWTRLRERAATVGVTPPVALLTAFTEVLTTWSRNSHYCLMLTLFDRDPSHPDAHRVVGDFTSLSLLEVDHRAPAAFTASARALQDRLWNDLDHRLVSGVDVARESARLRGGRPALLAPVVFTSNLGLGPPPAQQPIGDLRFAVTQTPQLYIDHQASETPDGVLLTWDVVAELFPDGLVDDAFDAYLDLLTRLADGRHDWDEPTPALLPRSQLDRRAARNATAVVRSTTTLPRLAAGGVAVDPSALAIAAGRHRLSHRDVLDRAGRIAGALRAAGAGPGDVVAVVAAKGWEQAVAVIGVTTAGAAYLPLDPELPRERLRQLCDRTRVRHVLTQTRLLETLPALPGAWVRPIDTNDGWTTPPIDPRNPLCAPGDLAYVIFTSGSTGVPKGVMIDHAGAVNTIEDVNRRFAVTATDRVLGLSSLSFDLSVYDIFGALATGGALVLPVDAEVKDPGRWLDLVRGHGVTVWNSVPALMGLAVDRAESSGEDLATLKLVLLSGDWIPLDLPARVQRVAPAADVIGLGGATEASIWSVHHPTAHPAPGWTSVPYGAPLANQTAHVLDAAMRPRPDWVPGELYLGGDGLALGYWEDAERTAAAFVRHPKTGERLYRTGDIARYHPDGTLEFLGRDDHQVKINGFRVELGEVEAALRALPGVEDGVVVAVGPPRGDRRLAAFYVPDGADPGESAVRDGLRADLPGYLVPTTAAAIPSLPLTGNGKVDRGALTARAAQPPDAGAARTESVAPDADQGLVTALAETLRIVLDVPQVGAQDSFFALGGTSLVALRLIARLQTELGVRIPLAEVYDNPTAAGLATAVAAARAGGTTADTTLELIPDPSARFDPFPLTPIQEAYWLGSRDGQWLGGVSTHSYVELDVVHLDLDRLEGAVRQLVHRHDALRTVLLADGTQQVLAHVPDYRIERLDLRQADPAERESMLADLRAELSHRRQDLHGWPLFTVRASRLDPARTRLHISIDLVIADALSFQILQRDLLSLYDDPTAGALPELDCHFRDYRLAVHRAADDADHRRSQAYWRDRLPTLPPPPQLPTRDLGTAARPRFTRLEGSLDAEQWSAVRRRAAEHDLTPSGLLCAAFAEVLALWTQTARFTLNVTTFNRLPVHPDIDNVVGDFTTTTLLAVDASAPTFGERAATLQAQLFTDLDHRAVGGVDVLRMLRGDPAHRGRAWAPVVFTSMLQVAPGGPAARPWEATVVYGISQTPQVLLDHQVYEEVGTLRYNWDHLADAFPPGLIDAMFAAYGTLLHSLATDGAYLRTAPGWPA